MGSCVRRCTRDDARAVAAIYDPVVAGTTVSFEDVPPGAIEMARRIDDGRDRFPWVVFDDGGVVVGYAYAAQHRSRAAYAWAVDVSVYVAPEARRVGVARGLYAELFRLLTAQGYCTAVAGVALPNEPSCRLHEALGFSRVGVYHAVGFKHGAWRDVLWFERRLRPTDEPPPALLPLTAL